MRPNKNPSAFGLTVFPVNQGEYGIELLQRQKEPERKRKKLKSLVRVSGLPLNLTLEPLISVLRRKGYNPEASSATEKPRSPLTRRKACPSPCCFWR